MRDDAESVFVAVDELTTAALGDVVVFVGERSEIEPQARRRRGTIVDLSGRDGEPFFRVELEPDD